MGYESEGKRDSERERERERGERKIGGPVAIIAELFRKVRPS